MCNLIHKDYACSPLLSTQLTYVFIITVILKNIGGI